MLAYWIFSRIYETMWYQFTFYFYLVESISTAILSAVTSFCHDHGYWQEVKSKIILVLWSCINLTKISNSLWCKYFTEAYITSPIYLAYLLWHYPKFKLKLLDRWFDKETQEIDREPWLLMPVLMPTREQAYKKYGLIIPDFLGILQLIPGIYSAKQH